MDSLDFSGSFLHTSFNKNHLTFLTPTPNGSTRHDQILPKDSSNIDDEVEMITHVDVWTQSYDPIISLTLIFPILTIFASSAIFIQIRTLQMLSQENSVNNSIMVTQARIHILFWPCMIIINTLTDNIYPLAKYLTPLFCTFFSFYFWFCSFSIILYSFYAALLRYLCCVHTEWVNGFGMRRLITIIYWMFYLHTVLWALYNLLTSFELDHIPIVNKCYGYDDRIFLMESTRLKALQRHICAINFEGGATMAHKIILCSANSIFGLIVAFNIPEFFFYRAIYKKEMRTNEERLRQFGDSLSNRNKIYRAKRIDVNVKVNFLAYAVEVLGTIVIVLLSVLRPPTFLYFGVLIWYGNVIPSCYLINSNDTKKFIMDQGWMAAMFELYKKKIPKEAQNAQQKAAAKNNLKKEPSNPSNNDNSKKDVQPNKPIQKEQCPEKNIEMKTLRRQDCQNCQNCRTKNRADMQEEVNNKSFDQEPHCSKDNPQKEEPAAFLPNQPDYS